MKLFSADGSRKWTSRKAKGVVYPKIRREAENEKQTEAESKP